MLKLSLSSFVALVYLSGVFGFLPTNNCNNAKTPTSRSLAMLDEKNMKKTAASIVAATFLMGNVVSIAPAFAEDNAMDMTNSATSSSQMISARSGGRAGGRSAGARAAPRRSSVTNTRVIQRNTYVSPPLYSSPGIIMAPPIYNPYPGIGFGLGLNAINQIGNDMRDYRQENEIRDTRYQLEQSRMREEELEARLKALEQQQGQLTPQQQMMLQQIQQQKQGEPAAAQ